MGRLTGKRSVSVLVAVPLLVLLLAATRPWLTGRSADPLTGGGALTAGGSQVAPGVAALALVGLAALVVALTGRRAVRRTAALALVLVAAGSLVLTARVLADPDTALGRAAATTLGRTGTVAAAAQPTPWLWLALGSAAVLLAASVLMLGAVGSWSGLSSRYEGPAGTGDGGEDRGGEERRVRRSAWDEVTHGRDPTLGRENGPST